jgi:hypothetical protein
MSRSIRVDERWRDVLLFLKTHYPVYHRSNIFLRDLQFGVQRYLAKQGVKVTNREAEHLAGDLAARLEKEHILQKLNRQTWVVDRPEYRKEPVKPAATAAKPAPAKPAPAAPAAQAPVA